MKNLDTNLNDKSKELMDQLVEWGSIISINNVDPYIKTNSVISSTIFDKLAIKYFPNEYFYLAYRI